MTRNETPQSFFHYRRWDRSDQRNAFPLDQYTCRTSIFIVPGLFLGSERSVTRRAQTRTKGHFRGLERKIRKIAQDVQLRRYRRRIHITTVCLMHSWGGGSYVIATLVVRGASVIGVVSPEKKRLVFILCSREQRVKKGQTKYCFSFLMTLFLMMTL